MQSEQRNALLSSAAPPVRDDGQAAASDATEFWSAKQLCGRYGISRLTLWRWQRDQGYPKPAMTVGNRNYYDPAHVLAWEAKQRAANNSEAA